MVRKDLSTRVLKCPRFAKVVSGERKVPLEMCVVTYSAAALPRARDLIPTVRAKLEAMEPGVRAYGDLAGEGD